MGKEWDYSKMVHSAKINGGPENYVNLIKNNSFSKGMLKGKQEGRTEVLIAEGIVAGIGLLGAAGYKAYTTIRENKERERLKNEEKKVRKAEKKIIKELNEAIAKEEGKQEEETGDEEIS